MAAGPGAPFQTAAEVWQGYRAGELDPETYGVFPGSPFAGPDFIRGYVIFQVAHRFGDELLLWDDWGATAGSGDEEMIDRLADLLVRADAVTRVPRRSSTPGTGPTTGCTRATR